MKELVVCANESNQRLDKLLHKHLNLATTSFLYKMLRKKNIVLNGKKATGSEIVQTGDRITFWLSDETYEKFSAHSIAHSSLRLDCLYEDENILAFYKPAGVLSQKAAPGDDSAADYVIQYLLDTGQITKDELKGFTPSIANRLDRNTSGILLAGKTLSGLQWLSEALRSRTIEKYYLALVHGTVTESGHLTGYLLKDPKSNQVRILQDAVKGASRIETVYMPLCTGNNASLLRVSLLTGKSHQIRAHLASVGHPIVGDPKYGQKDPDLPGQLLHAWEVKLPNNITIQAPPPDYFLEAARRFDIKVE